MSEDFYATVLALNRIRRRIARDHAELDYTTKLLRDIADALGTGETGQALVDVARQAHAAELRAARLINRLESDREYAPGNWSLAAQLRG